MCAARFHRAVVLRRKHLQTESHQLAPNPVADIVLDCIDKAGLGEAKPGLIVLELQLVVDQVGDISTMRKSMVLDLLFDGLASIGAGGNTRHSAKSCRSTSRGNQHDGASMRAALTHVLNGCFARSARGV
jgi:hypothetical protein